MEAGQIRRLADQFIEALHALEHGNSAQVDQMVQMYAPDAHLSNAALVLSGTTRQGQDGAREFWEEYRRQFGTVNSDFYRITVGDDSAGLFWTTRGTSTDGHDITYDGSSLLVFDADGNIAEFRGYYDTQQLNETLGVAQQ